MTEASVDTSCLVCGRTGTVAMEPPRRTFARGADPTDPSFSIIAVLPDMPLCDEHAEGVVSREVSIGWCDDEQCRQYGERGEASPCGEPFRELKR